LEIIAIITVLVIIEYMLFSFRVGMARGKYDVAAPATTGHEIFERYYRVQQNTVEQLIIFLPALWIFAQFTSVTGAAVLGTIFILARAYYAISYYADPEKRGPGFLIGFLANAILVVGSLYGAIKGLL
jgi:glutathione S-transferase